MTSFIEKSIETTERIVIEYANLSGRGSVNRAEFRKRIHEIITSALTHQLNELKGKVKGNKFTDLPLNAPSILLETEKCVTAFQKKGYNQAISNILTLIDSMK